ncbi:MAG: DUF4835 family protein [Chitinophagales bacterium]|jgi:hypothetical protein
MLIRSIATFLFSLFLIGQSLAQGELNATVRINAPQLQRTDRKVIEQLEIALRDFLNNTKWTSDGFLPDERIKCTFIMTIESEGDNNSFTANLAVQSTRPVFNSGYETTLLATQDKDVSFVYEQNQPIQFVADNAENQNLPSIFAFYVYIILGLDYDSYSQYGGENYLQTAQQMIVNIQNSSNNKSPGWKQAGGDKNRSRYWLIENLVSPRMRNFRNAIYTYHRLGLDQFASNQEEARAAILNALEDIDRAGVAYLNSMVVQLFSQAKREEIVEMMKNATIQQRQRVYQIMIKADPANAQRYKDMGV